MRQVRIPDDIAARLEEQGGSLSAAASRTLAWALEAIDTIEAADNSPEPVDHYDPAPAGNTDPPRARVGTSRRAANARLFAAAARRTW